MYGAALRYLWGQSTIKYLNNSLAFWGTGSWLPFNASGRYSSLLRKSPNVWQVQQPSGTRDRCDPGRLSAGWPLSHSLTNALFTQTSSFWRSTGTVLRWRFICSKDTSGGPVSNNRFDVCRKIILFFHYTVSTRSKEAGGWQSSTSQGRNRAAWTTNGRAQPEAESPTWNMILKCICVLGIQRKRYLALSIQFVSSLFWINRLSFK